MILSFNKQQFVDRILEGTKIHTIREDKHNRWKPGNKIHAWYKNPRNVKQNPKTFEIYIWDTNFPGRREAFKEDLEACPGWFKIPKVCKSVQTIDIGPICTRIDGRILTNDEMIKLALNDGFENLTAFYDWFSIPFKGKIIHWTNFKY